MFFHFFQKICKVKKISHPKLPTQFSLFSFQFQLKTNKSETFHWKLEKPKTKTKNYLYFWNPINWSQKDRKSNIPPYPALLQRREERTLQKKKESGNKRTPENWGLNESRPADPRTWKIDKRCTATHEERRDNQSFVSKKCWTKTSWPRGIPNICTIVELTTTKLGCMCPIHSRRIVNTQPRLRDFKRSVLSEDENVWAWRDRLASLPPPSFEWPNLILPCVDELYHKLRIRFSLSLHHASFIIWDRRESMKPDEHHSGFTCVSISIWFYDHAVQSFISQFFTVVNTPDSPREMTTRSWRSVPMDRYSFIKIEWNCHFHQKTFIKNTFIKNQFHPNHFHQKTTFIRKPIWKILDRKPQTPQHLNTLNS